MLTGLLGTPTLHSYHFLLLLCNSFNEFVNRKVVGSVPLGYALVEMLPSGFSRLPKEGVNIVSQILKFYRKHHFFKVLSPN